MQLFHGEEPEALIAQITEVKENNLATHGTIIYKLRKLLGIEK